MIALRSEFKSGLIAAGVGFVVGGIFFATVKVVSKTEAYGYGGVVLFSSLVSVTFGLVTTGASLAVEDEEGGAIAKAPRPMSIDAAIALPQPVDNMSRLGGTTDERVLATLNWDVATGRAKSELLVDGLRELNRYRSNQLPDPAEDSLPLPAPRQEPQAVQMPTRRYEPPVIDHPNPPVQPHLYGMDDEDLWGNQDSMSGYDTEPEEEDIFA